MSSSRRTKHGHLTVGVTTNSSGRKIDTWTFRSGDVAGRRDLATEIVFEVSMFNTLEFAVNTKGIPKERWEPLTGTNLADLHAKALEICRFEFDLRNDLKWSDWLEIRIQEPSAYERRDVVDAAQAFLSYSVIPRAEKPDGTAFTINGNGVLVSFPEPVGVAKGVDGMTGTRRDPVKEEQIKAQHPDEQFGSLRLSALLKATDQRDPNTQFAYLPDTPENRAGLDAIVRGINDINLRLQEFLAPETITHTLARAATAGHRLLAGPEADTPQSEAPPTSPRRRGP